MKIMSIISIYTKLAIVFLVVATAIFAAIIIAGSPHWWVPTIFYSISALLAWGEAAYGLWKAHKKKGKTEGE
jgi:hypothetical protein